MSPDGDTLSGRSQIGFRSHRVLVVTQVIASVGQQFNQSDSNIGCVSFVPGRHDKCQPVQNQLSETLVVLRQIVDIRLCSLRRWTNVLRFAIELAGASGLEAELHLAISGIET